MNIECYFDGACGPVGPLGHTSWGLVVRGDKKIIHQASGYVGVGEGMSNNVGEYAGCIAALKYLIANQITEALIIGDSKMVVRQLSGRMKARKGFYIPYYKEAKTLVAQLPKVQFKHVRREHNIHADWLASRELRNARLDEIIPDRQRQIKNLVQSQREDRHDPRFKVVASNPTSGTPF